MSELEILWLDDDSPKRVEGFKGIKVVTAQTCEQAEHLLTSGTVNPKWAVVDLIVPQGNWGGTVKKLPGLHFINHLKQTYGDRLGVLAFSIIMPDKIRERVIQAGAEDAIAKSSKSLGALVEELRRKESK